MFGEFSKEKINIEFKETIFIDEFSSINNLFRSIKIIKDKYDKEHTINLFEINKIEKDNKNEYTFSFSIQRLETNQEYEKRQESLKAQYELLKSLFEPEKTVSEVTPSLFEFTPTTPAPTFEENNQ